jgi:multiple sugar transport system substrate-binding protein
VSETKELTGEISFSTWGSLEEKKVNEDIIKLFEEKHPGVNVKLEYIPDEYVTKIDTMFLGNNAPT